MAGRPTNASDKPVLVFEMSATKDTKGTVRIDTTAEWNEKNGSRGTNIYIPKDVIPADGGLRSTKFRVEIYPV